MPKRKLPDPRVFTVQDLTQQATFDIPKRRKPDGDIKDDGTDDKYFRDLRIGERVVEELNVSICAPLTQEIQLNKKTGSLDAFETNFRQFAIKFPYCQTTLEYYKRAIKIGKKDISVVLPKIHRIETKCIPLPRDRSYSINLWSGNPYAPGHAKAGEQDTSTATKKLHSIYSTGLTLCVNNSDMRSNFLSDILPPTERTQNTKYDEDTEAVRKYWYPHVSPNNQPRMPLSILRHIVKPMYCKVFPFSGVNVSSQDFEVAWGDNPSTDTDTFYRTQTKPGFSELGETLPYWNEKKLPFQLWSPELFVGISGIAVDCDILISVEYSYEMIEGQDYWYRENGFVSQETIEETFREEPSKLFACATSQTTDTTFLYDSLSVKTQRLAIEQTPSKVGNLSDIPEKTPAPQWVYKTDDQKYKVKYPEEIEGCLNYNPACPFSL